MKIYTKTGDAGLTSLLGGTRVPKHHIRIEAYGTIDELNSYLGLLSDQNETLQEREFLRAIQNQLFLIGSHLANDPDHSHFKLAVLPLTAITDLEKSIDKMDEVLPALKNFVLPGGLTANSIAHIARCICRRAERNVVHLNELSPVDPLILQYLNRLSDWLFTYSRYLSQQANAEEVLWKG